MNKTPEDIRAIVEELKVLYPDGICSLEYKKDYELLFSVRLAAQCTDERVNKVTPALYARFPTLEALADADISEVEQYIHSTGFSGPRQRILFWPLRCFCETMEEKCPAPWRIYSNCPVWAVRLLT